MDDDSVTVRRIEIGHLPGLFHQLSKANAGFKESHVELNLLMRGRVESPLLVGRSALADQPGARNVGKVPLGPIRSVSKHKRSPASILRLLLSCIQGFVRSPDVSNRVSIHSPP